MTCSERDLGTDGLRKGSNLRMPRSSLRAARPESTFPTCFVGLRVSDHVDRTARCPGLARLPSESLWRLLSLCVSSRSGRLPVHHAGPSHGLGVAPPALLPVRPPFAASTASPPSSPLLLSVTDTCDGPHLSTPSESPSSAAVPWDG